jgi:hypothetical protein
MPARTVKPAKTKSTTTKSAAKSPAKPAPPAAPKGGKPRPSRTGLLARPVVVDLEVDRELRKRWQRALEVIKDAKREGASAFDVLWETVAEIIEHDPPLYLAGGVATAKDFLAQHLNETERTARRWMRVAKYASPAEEVRYGVSRLDAVIGYLEAKSGGALKGSLPVAFDKLKIPVDRDGKTVHLPLEEATVEAIHLATRKLNRAEQRPPRSASPALVAVTRELSKGKLRGVSARIAAGKLMLGAIPLDALADLADALRRMKLPEKA